ncbi:MAG: hypothetical protein RLZZ297_1759 [Chloroflexota bacterium]|jgi:hypothetical protein
MRRMSLLLGALLVLTGCSDLTGALSSLGKTRLQQAVESCADKYSGYIDVLDNGKTLSIDGDGKEDEGSPIEETACVFFAIPVPSYIISRIDNTRAMDGMQRETFDGFDISWSYHPDDGLDAVIHEQ